MDEWVDVSDDQLVLIKGIGPEYDAMRNAVKYAASCLRKIAAGEYKQVVHAHIFGKGYDLHCSNCGVSADIGKNYCHFCGAVFDGKDDSHE